MTAARTFPGGLTFDADLEAAGIPKVDAPGGAIDFHALRTTLISWLAASGAHPRLAQALARHANIETTMERYTEVWLLDLKGAVGRLPWPSKPVGTRATGKSA